MESGKYNHEKYAQISKAYHAEDERLGRMFDFAEEKHRGQLRKDGITDFIMHPINSERRIRELGGSIPQRMGGLGHDTVEDCDATIEEVFEKFGPEVGYYVMYMTREDGMWRDTYLDRIAQADPKMQLIKLADVENNMSTVEQLKISSQVRYVEESKRYYLPIAEKISQNLYTSISGLVDNVIKRLGLEGLVA
jgi:GTP diphosphokinase / guanosine-3',5'-bis(diphosphate) 3'-diphosphatase